MQQFKDLYTLFVASKFGDIKFRCNICNKVHNSLKGNNSYLAILVERIEEKLEDKKWQYLIVDERLLATNFEKVMATAKKINKTKAKEEIEGIKVRWWKENENPYRA